MQGDGMQACCEPRLYPDVLMHSVQDCAWQPRHLQQLVPKCNCDQHGCMDSEVLDITA